MAEGEKACPFGKDVGFVKIEAFGRGTMDQQRSRPSAELALLDLLKVFGPNPDSIPARWTQVVGVVPGKPSLWVSGQSCLIRVDSRFPKKDGGVRIPTPYLRGPTQVLTLVIKVGPPYPYGAGVRLPLVFHSVGSRVATDSRSFTLLSRKTAG